MNDSDREKPSVITCVVSSQGEESEHTQVQRHLRVFVHAISTAMFSNIVNRTENICVDIFSILFSIVRWWATCFRSLVLQPAAIFMNTLGLHYIPNYTHINGQLKEKKKKQLVEQSRLLFAISRTPLWLLSTRWEATAACVERWRVWPCKLYGTYGALDILTINLYSCSDRQHCRPRVQPQGLFFHRSTVHSLQHNLISVTLSCLRTFFALAIIKAKEINVFDWQWLESRN